MTVIDESAYATGKIINTSPNQYAGAGLFMTNNVSSLGGQAGVAMYAGINDTAATKGFFTLDKTDKDGNNTGHLWLFDLDTNRTTLYQSLTLSQSGSGATPFRFTRADDGKDRIYIDGYGGFHFGGTGATDAQFILDKDPLNTKVIHLRHKNGPASILSLTSNTNATANRNAESTFTGKVQNAVGTDTEFIDWYHNHYEQNGGIGMGIMMQKIGGASYRQFTLGYYDHANDAESETTRDQELFFVIEPDAPKGVYQGSPVTGTASVTSGSNIVTGNGTSFTTELKVHESIRIGGNSRKILSVDSDTQLTTVAPWPTNASNQTVRLYNRSRGRMAIRHRNPEAFLDIAGGIGGSTTGSASLKLRPAEALLDVPEDGALEYDGTHLYFTIGSTRHQII